MRRLSKDSILISIKSKYVKKILNKEKTIEIRKTRPNCELPCKVYIYCTKDDKSYSLNGKVVAEFELNNIKELSIKDPYICIDKEQINWKEIEKTTASTSEEIMNYLGYGDEYNFSKGYAWYIDNLKIYGEPKELNNFKKQNKCYNNEWFLTEDGVDGNPCFEACTFYDIGECDGRCSKIEKSPQSWCYIEDEELED